MAQEFSWLKALGVGVVSTGLVFGGAATLGVFDDKQVDLSGVATKEDLAKVLNLTVTTAADVEDLQSGLLKEDVWEATAEVLAIEEVEDKNYKELGRFILNSSNATSDDVEELDLSVEVKDVEFSGMDEDDQNGVVTFELRVRYEDANGDNKKTTVTATVEIEDGEVEDITFA